MPYCTRNGVKKLLRSVAAKDIRSFSCMPIRFDRRMFLYQVAHLSTHFKVINIDLRGYGYSDKPSCPGNRDGSLRRRRCGLSSGGRA